MQSHNRPVTCLITFSGEIVYIDEQIVLHTQSLEDEFVGKNWRVACPPTEWNKKAADYSTLIATAQPIVMRRVYKRSDNSTISADVASRILDMPGREPLIQNTAFFLHERHSVEALSPNASIRHKADVADYIHEMTASLANLAHMNRLGYIAHLLKAASREASQEVGELARRATRLN